MILLVITPDFETAAKDPETMEDAVVGELDSTEVFRTSWGYLPLACAYQEFSELLCLEVLPSSQSAMAVPPSSAMESEVPLSPVFIPGNGLRHDVTKYYLGRWHTSAASGEAWYVLTGQGLYSEHVED